MKGRLFIFMQKTRKIFIVRHKIKEYASKGLMEKTL